MKLTLGEPHRLSRAEDEEHLKDMAGSPHPGFGNSGKCFLIENLLRPERCPAARGPPGPLMKRCVPHAPSVISVSLPRCAGPVLTASPLFPKMLWSPALSSRTRTGILRRAVFSDQQRRELEKTFHKQKYISKTERNRLASDLCLKETQVHLSG
ncbi:homeobox protein DBX2 isoform X2 [Puntigrus tetrazona]|uniref:homeobox protein DBX2 isoform X2 n=1 Tax=Puntigrus tetrazona TaxID=1606681 RepID=UPI001C8AA926|nr:homeobox protein DBX2 isoform X2 [Puntigrus tetrazona]